jgi:predicted choloylglycine hydrolase
MKTDPSFPFPVVSVSGANHREIGRQIGALLKDRIQGAHRARKDWIDQLEAFAQADPATRLDPFVKAVRDCLPHLLEEMEGMALGADLPLSRLLVVALNPELSALMKTASPDEDCTTVALNSSGKLWIAHNEDGNQDLLDFMYLLHITWPDGLVSFAFSYPGYWPGNAPSANSAGLAQTVNYISARHVRPGLPRYAIDRAIMEARDLDQAIAWAAHPQRAYSQHHYLLSHDEGRIVSVEAAADQVSIREVKGLEVHANHFVHPEMKDLPQFDSYHGTSRPRQEAAERWRDGINDPAALTPGDLISILSSHENAPLSICRHPAPQFPGATLGAALLLAKEKRIRFFARQPCQNKALDLPWPGGS